MKINKIRFQNLPFNPESNQVFYIENGYDEQINRFIQKNYTALKKGFEKTGMKFVYLPYLVKEEKIEDRIRYYAPYLTSEKLVTNIQSNVFVNYIDNQGVRDNLTPSLIYGCWHAYGNTYQFKSIALGDLENSDTSATALVSQIIYAILDEELTPELLNYDTVASPVSRVLTNREKKHKSLNNYNSISQKSVCSRFHEFKITDFSKEESILSELADDYGKIDLLNRPEVSEQILTEEAEEELRSHFQTEKILSELYDTVQKLRLQGISLMAIHELIDKQEPLSKMVITPDYRIFLPDYNNIEIEMGALPKAVYFLFLRYPEGIVYKHMQDHYTELKNIYKQLRPNTDEARLNLTITKVVNPFGNALNENMARIKKAFFEKFDEHLAKNYIISGEQGFQYSISIDRNLIIWEE